MAEKGHQGYANTDEERRQNKGTEGGHASHERGTVHEFNAEAGDGGRRGGQGHAAAHGSGDAAGLTGAEGGNGAGEGEHRSRKTRGGTHDQHVTAGKKGGSRIRELIELGYKYEREHGIGPGQNERSKLAAKRRAAKGGENEGGTEGE
jgi:hypothetical protein